MPGAAQEGNGKETRRGQMTRFTKEDVFSIGATILYLNRHDRKLVESIGVKFRTKIWRSLLSLENNFHWRIPALSKELRRQERDIGPHIDDLIVNPELKPFMLDVEARTGIRSFRGEVFRMMAVLNDSQLRNLKQVTLAPGPMSLTIKLISFINKKIDNF